MPKTKSVKSVKARDNGPYSLTEVKNKLKTWKNEAQEYEKRTSVHFDHIKAYLSSDMTKMSSDDVVNLYDCVSKALDHIERKGTTRIARLDNFVTSMVEDKNLDEEVSQKFLYKLDKLFYFNFF